MKKIRNILVAAIAIASLTASFSFANNFGAGITGSLATVGGNGQQNEGTGGSENEDNRSAAHTTTPVGSIFIEYTADSLYGMTIGFDYVPGKADVSDKKITRTDVRSALSAATTDNGDYSAEAELSDHMTVYLELPIHAGLYAKLGYTEMDVDVTTTAVSGSTYGDTTADGYVVGFGYKNDFGTNGYYKVEGSLTDFGEVKSTNSTNSDSVTADIDVTRATFALGYKF